MLGTVGVKLTDFLNPELSWKTATRGFRTSRKRSRIWANSILKDARSPHRDWTFVSESEKHGVAVLGRRFADHVEHVPFKKRRLLRQSSSPPSRNQPPSLKSTLNKKRHGKGASVECCSADLDCLSEAMTFEDKIVSVFSPTNADKCLKDRKPPKFMCGKKYLDFSGIALLAATACSNMINDIGDAKEESIADQPSAAKITETVASVTSVDAVLKEPVTSVDAVDQLEPSPERKPSDAQDIPTAELRKAVDVNASQSASVKYDRLHWDLNTEMEAWGQPFDDGLSCPHGSHSERLQKTEGGDPEHSLVPLGQYPLDNNIQSSVEICPFISVMQTREECSLHDVYFGLPVEGKVTSVEGGNHEEDIREPSHFPAILGEEACQTVNREHSMNKLGIMNSSCESLEQEENLCLLGATVGEMQPRQVVNVPSEEKVVAATPDTSPIVYLQSNKSPDKSVISSVISNVENHCMMVNERISEAQTGYDSPFEDGELREDHVLYLGEQDNEVEYEIDSLDYEDDGEVEHNASNSCPQESSSPECQNMRKGNSSGSLVQDGIGDDMMGLTQSASSNTKQSGRDQLPEGCEATSGTSVATNAVNSSVGKGSCASENGPKALGRNRLFPHLKGPSRQSDVIHRKDAVYAKQTGSNNLDEASALALEEREVGSDKCFRRVSSSLQDKDQKDDDCVGSSASYWDSRHTHYLTSYHHHPQESDDYSRPIDDKPRGLNYHGQRQPISYSSKGASLMKPPCNTEGHCVEHKRGVSLRDDSRSRSRGSRPAITGQGFTRSTRNDFPSAAPNDLASDNHSLISAQMVHSLPQRKHGISHVPLRGANFRPHRKSRSRSRTRSPPVWNFPRERYIGAKRRRLRFEARMKRTLSPFTKSSFTSDEEDNSLPSSGRFSSKYHSKWNDSRNDDFERISNRSERMFKRNQRFDWVDSTGRTKFDEQFRGGMIRQGRCTDMIGRGSNYDSCDVDRRKHTGKYEMIHRVRRYNTDGFVKRYRNDAEDFEDHSIHGENRYSRSRDDRREIIRNTREERGSFRCSSGRTYMSCPKFSAISDTYEDVSPRKR